MSAEKHGLAAASYQPQRPDWTIEQNWQHYSAEEHAPPGKPCLSGKAVYCLGGLVMHSCRACRRWR